MAPPAMMLSWSLYSTPYNKSSAPSTIKNIRKKSCIILPAAGTAGFNKANSFNTFWIPACQTVS